MKIVFNLFKILVLNFIEKIKRKLLKKNVLLIIDKIVFKILVNSSLQYLFRKKSI
jgi:hypothetical protein